MKEGVRKKQKRGPQRKFPEDYHDYVFKNGRLVGDFDNMYRYAKGTPWDQDKRCDHWHTEVGMLMMKEKAPYGTILEIGCGLGYIAAKLKGFAIHAVDAFDLSPEAVRKASALHPGIRFYVDDISSVSFRPKRQYDLVVILNTFFYVYKKMETVVRNINACVKPNGFLYIGQAFPSLADPFVGKTVIPNPETLTEYFRNYDLVYSALLRNHHLDKDGPIFNFLGAKVS